MKNNAQIAYALMVMLGEIQNEMERGGEAVTLDEIKEMYGMASKLNDHFSE